MNHKKYERRRHSYIRTIIAMDEEQRIAVGKIQQLETARDHWIESYDRLELEYKLLIDELQTLKE